jgi:LacI family transcriptional regulator
MISGPLSTSTGRDRLVGFRDTMARAGLDVDDALVHPIPFRGDAGSDAVGTLLSLPKPPTALIVGNTAQVRSALRRIKQSGIELPGALSLIAFDDNPWTELVSPPLTVIRQPIDMLALHSVELALGRARGNLTEPPRRVDVDAEFVRRASTAAVVTTHAH